MSCHTPVQEESPQRWTRRGRVDADVSDDVAILHEGVDTKPVSAASLSWCSDQNESRATHVINAHANALYMTIGAKRSAALAVLPPLPMLLLRCFRLDENNEARARPLSYSGCTLSGLPDMREAKVSKHVHIGQCYRSTQS